MSEIYYPYYFKQWDNDSYLLVNMVGEHIFLDTENFHAFADQQFARLTEAAREKLYTYNFLSRQQDKELVENLLATKLRSRKNFLNLFTSLHMVVLTLRCNSICDYCHAGSQAENCFNTDMSLDVADKTLDMILQSPTTEITIEFQGGEPTLNWEALRFFVSQGQKRIKKFKNKHLTFVVCTNLVDLSKEKLNFLIENHVQISTSCDGPKFLHDLHRKGRNGNSTYDAFLTNLEYLRSLGEKTVEVNALLTVTKDNLIHLRDVVDEYVKLGFHNMFIRALNPYGYAIKNKKSLSYSTEDFVYYYRDALLYIIELNKKGIFFSENYAALLFQRLMTPFSTGFVDLQSPSGAGISGAIYYYNGDVFPADEGRMLATMGDNHFRMGNVMRDSYRDIFYGRIIQDLVENSCVESMPRCSTCVYSPYCGADPIRNYLECGNIIHIDYDNNFCVKNKLIFKVLFDLIRENDPKTISILWSWVNRFPMEDI